MVSFHTILCPIDFSEHSLPALKYAVAFAKDFSSKLIVQHTVPDILQTMPYMDTGYFPMTEGVLIMRAGEELDRILKKHCAGAYSQIDKNIDVGEAGASILQKIRGESVNLVIMGTHGKGGFDPYLAGSVTTRVLHRSPIPVLVLGGPAQDQVPYPEEGPIALKRILCAIDFERGSESIREAAIHLAKKYQAETLFFHVQDRMEENDWLDEQRVALEDSLKRESEAIKSVPYRFLVETGYAAQEIIKAVDRHQVDLVIIGHHTKRPLEETVLGSVAIRVVSEAHCPVMVIRN